jgi:exopolyphosphatase/guanosine-5'-triphosphate,3'-diphosphate pyrophosphatase
VFGAVDLGTNNCRLLIARPAGGGFRVLDGFSRVVRLGEGMTESGQLSEAAMRRAVEALRVCAGKLERRNVTRARAIATEACRQAANCGDFIDRVKAEAGLDLEIISSREEAELTLAGCLPLLDPAVPYALMFDVGGGSAEVVWLRLQPGAAPRILGWVSLPCGVVTLTERNGHHDFSPEAYAAVVAAVEAQLAPFEQRFAIRSAIRDGAVQMLGTAGTVTTVAGVNMGLPRYNRSLVDGCYLSFEAIARITAMLAGTTYAERLAHSCIGESRADLVVAGCAVLDAICRTWPVGVLRVADRGVREGILMALIGSLDRTGFGTAAATVQA